MNIILKLCIMTGLLMPCFVRSIEQLPLPLAKLFHGGTLLRLKNETGKKLTLEVRIPCLHDEFVIKKPLRFVIAEHYDAQKFDLLAQLQKEFNENAQLKREIPAYCFKDYKEETTVPIPVVSFFIEKLLRIFYVPASPITMRVIDTSGTICRTFSCDSSSDFAPYRPVDCEPVAPKYVDTGFVHMGPSEYTIKIIQGTLRITDKH